MNTLVEPLSIAELHAESHRTLPALLKHRSARNGDSPLFSDRSTTWTARDAIDVASRRAGALAGYGIQKGDRVAILCGNRIEFMEIVLFCLLALLASQVVSGFANDSDVVKRSPNTAARFFSTKQSGLRGVLSRVRAKIALF